MCHIGFRRPYFHPYFFPPLSLTLLIKKATCAWSHPSHCSLDGRFIFISTGNLCAAAVLLEVQSRTNLSRFDRPARLHRVEKYSQGGHLIKANTYSQPPSSISNVAMRCIFRKIESWTWNDAKASSKGKQGLPESHSKLKSGENMWHTRPQPDLHPPSSGTHLTYCHAECGAHLHSLNLFFFFFKECNII